MILSAIGSVISGIAAMSQASYQAAIAKANAKQARLNAQLAFDVAGEEAQDIGTENLGVMGELLAGQGASGIGIGSPSAARSRTWLGAVAYKDQIRRVEEGNRQGANYQTQANVFDAEASAHKTAGMFGLIGGIINAGSSLVGSSGGSIRSPSFLPIRTVRNRYNPGRALAGVV